MPTKKAKSPRKKPTPAIAKRVELDPVEHVKRQLVQVNCAMTPENWEALTQVQFLRAMDDENPRNQLAVMSLIEIRKADLMGTKMLLDGVLSRQAPQEMPEQRSQEDMAAGIAGLLEHYKPDTVPMRTPVVRERDPMIVDSEEVG